MDLVYRYINEKPVNDKEARISSWRWDKFMERILLCTSGMEIWPLEAVNTENIKNYFDLLRDVLEKKKKIS